MLEINNLSVTFNKGSAMEKRALRNVSLSLDEGDFVTVIGSNGAGKSTLLAAIFGLVKITRGRIRLGGVDITDAPAHKRAKKIGILFQNPLLGTAPDMTVEENLALASAKVRHRPFSFALSQKNREAIREELKTLGLGLEERLRVNVGMLSGGQRQALTLLMAASADPELLLLDEHTAALDPQTSINVMKKTDEIIAEKKLTTLMVTHNVRNALEYGNKLLLMDEGRVVTTIAGEDKKRLTVNDVMAFYQNNLSDSMIL